MASLLGVAWYEVDGAEERAWVLTLLDAEESELGTLSIVSDDGGALTMDLTPPGAEAPAGSLLTTFSAPDPAGPVQLVIELEVTDVPTVDGALSLGVRVLGDHDPLADPSSGGEWIQSVVLESPVADGEPLPGVGLIRPGADALVSGLATYDAGGAPTDEATVATWLVQTGLVELSETMTDDYLLASLFDLASLLDQIERGTGRTASPLSSGVDRQPLLECGDPLLESIHEVCVRPDSVGSCEPGDRVCVRYVLDAWDEATCVQVEDVSNVVDAFTSEGCLWSSLSCVEYSMQYATCISRQARVDDLNEYCSLEWRRCFDPYVAQPNAAANGCECVCDQDRCLQHCSLISDATGVFPIGPPRCVDSLTCDCDLAADEYCAAELPGDHCGGGEFDARAGGFWCPSARCGDGQFSPTCESDPGRAEICDDSSPDGQDCGEGQECVGCECLPCEVAVECGDGRVSRACPGLVEECDGEGQAQCADGSECEDCGCVRHEPTCQDETAPWVQGDECSLSCSTTIATPEGDWTDCIGENSRPGCEEPPSVPYLTGTYIMDGCEYYGPRFTWESDACDTACRSENLVYVAWNWFDLGRPAPAIEHSAWRAEREGWYVNDYDMCLAFDLECTQRIVFSATHWALVQITYPTRFGADWADAVIQDYLLRVEPLAWPQS